MGVGPDSAAATGADPTIPETVDELTAAWFTTTLGDDQRRVTGVRHERVGADVGFMGELWRCHLDWDPRHAGPGTVVVKLPGPPGPNRSLGEGLRAFEREIVVYRDLADGFGLPIPTYLHGAYDPPPPDRVDRTIVWLFDHLPVVAVGWLLRLLIALSGRVHRRYVLVIEDIADARPPSQVTGGSLDDVRTGLELLARFHAANWMRPDLVDHPLIWPIDRTPKVAQAAYRRNRDAFMARFGQILGSERIARMDATQRHAVELVRRLAAPPWTLLHGDYRLDNLLFRPDGSVVVVDHQGTAVGRPAWDVTYFITTALDPGHRDAETDLLRCYHDALVAAGIDDHPYDDLVADVATSKEVFAHRVVAGDDLIDTSRADTDDTLVDLIVERLAGWLD